MLLNIIRPLKDFKGMGFPVL